jgi:hypothetical protein
MALEKEGGCARHKGSVGQGRAGQADSGGTILAVLKLLRAVVHEHQRWAGPSCSPRHDGGGWRVRGVGAVRRHAVTQAQIVAAGYTSLEANPLLEEVLERLAGSQPTDPDTT